MRSAIFFFLIAASMLSVGTGRVSDFGCGFDCSVGETNNVYSNEVDHAASCERVRHSDGIK